MGRTARRCWVAIAAACVALASACLDATSSQFPVVDAGGSASSGDAAAFGDGALYKGACDTAATWQVAVGTGGGTITFVVPASAASGGTWSPAAGLVYSFNATTCTVTLTSAGCPGGSFDLATRACNVFTDAICEASACDAGCPSQTTACTLSGL